MPEMYVENRDMRCAADVGRMAALGRFDQELQVYGCAYVERGEVWYRVSSRQERISKFMADSARAGIYPTPMAHSLRRTPAPAGMYEALLAETKWNLVKKLKAQYSGRFFALLTEFTQVPPDNSSYDLLWGWRKR